MFTGFADVVVFVASGVFGFGGADGGGDTVSALWVGDVAGGLDCTRWTRSMSASLSGSASVGSVTSAGGRGRGLS